MRDVVDSRFNIGEFLIPVMFLVILLTLFPPVVQVYAMLLLWVFFALQSDVFLSAHEKQENKRICACVSRVVGRITLDTAWREEVVS